MFKQDDVSYRIIPVSGYPGLEQIRDDLASYEELQTLILINIGSILDLPSSDWFGEFNPKVTVHVIDSARPQNLSSLFGVGPNADRIVVWDDGSVNTLEDKRKALEALMMEPDSDSDSEDDDSEDDLPSLVSESEEDPDQDDYEVDFGEGRPRKRSRSDTNEGGGPSRRRRRRRKRPRAGLPRHVKQEYQERIEKHYASGTWYGQSASGTMYSLAATLERADNDMLWLSVLGLTYQYVASQIPRDKYDGYQAIFQDEVARLNPGIETSNKPSVSNPDDFRIRPSEELRFTLFRHWNLYDAMYHSSYVANKLGIWKEKGRKRLQGLLAKMGFSLLQCQQSYQNMDMDLKRELRQRMDSIAPEYGLVELSYPSFVRAFGFHSQPLCAADIVEAVSALLQAATGVRLEVENEGGRGGGEWFGGGHLWDMERLLGAQQNGAATSVSKWKTLSNDGSGTAATSSNMEEDLGGADGAESSADQWWVKNFWIAFDAVGKDITLIRHAFQLSMTLHRAIIRQGSSLIDKHAIHTYRTFKFALIKEGPDVPIFCQPGTLSRLGLWLADALRDKQPRVSAQGKRKPLPFVVACLHEKGGSYLVVGVNAPTEYGDVRKNRFGLAFLDAKEQSNARTRHGTFDTSVVEINKDDLTGFLEALQLA